MMTGFSFLGETIPLIMFRRLC